MKGRRSNCALMVGRVKSKTPVIHEENFVWGMGRVCSASISVPPLTLHAMLRRAAQVKADMMVTWQAIFKENYHKSLDHRSFYFKQTDKKMLTREKGAECGCQWSGNGGSRYGGWSVYETGRGLVIRSEGGARRVPANMSPPGTPPRLLVLVLSTPRALRPLRADRSMVQEIKDAAEKKRQERGAVLQAVSGRADFAARLQPHLTFDFTDMWVLLVGVRVGVLGARSVGWGMHVWA